MFRKNVAVKYSQTSPLSKQCGTHGDCFEADYNYEEDKEEEDCYFVSSGPATMPATPFRRQTRATFLEIEDGDKENRSVSMMRRKRSKRPCWRMSLLGSDGPNNAVPNGPWSTSHERLTVSLLEELLPVRNAVPCAELAPLLEAIAEEEADAQEKHTEATTTEYTGSRFDSQKPPYSYAQLIAESILAAPEMRLTLSSIYAAIQTRYPYYRSQNCGWQNSIRHNLSMSQCFKRVAAEEDYGEGRVVKRGKGAWWTVKEGFWELDGEGRRIAKLGPKKKPSTSITTTTSNNVRRKSRSRQPVQVQAKPVNVLENEYCLEGLFMPAEHVGSRSGEGVVGLCEVLQDIHGEEETYGMMDEVAEFRDFFVLDHLPYTIQHY